MTLPILKFLDEFRALLTTLVLWGASRDARVHEPKKKNTKNAKHIITLCRHVTP